MKATSTRIEFGKKLRELRKQMGLSQEELDFRANIHRTYIGSIERGDQNISVDNIHKLAKVLKVRADELFR